MAYTNLNILKMDTGSHEGTWGTQTNYNWDRIDSYISGYKEIELTGSSPDYVLDTTQDSIPSEDTGDGWNCFIKFKADSSAPTGSGTVTISPAGKTKLYFVNNSSGITLTFKYASTTGVALADGYSTIILANGTDVVKAIDVFETSTISADLIGSSTIGAGKALEVSSGGTVKLSGAYPTGSENVVMGKDAGSSLTSYAGENCLIGHEAGTALVGTSSPGTADDNTCVGYTSGKTLINGHSNTFIGSGSGLINLGDGNVGVGMKSCGGSGTSSTSCDGNVAIGYHALKDLTDAIGNVAIGQNAGEEQTTRDKGIYIGYNAGKTDPGADSILIIDHENKTSDQDELQFIWGDMANDKLKVNSAHTSNDVLTVNNTNATYTGNVVHLTTTDAADSGFDFIKGDANTVNQFRVNGAGTIYAQNTTVQPADFADMFEWSDGNPEGEDRIGLTVVVDETSEEGGVRPATSSDDPNDVIGAVSGTACVIGNAAWKGWDKKYLKDDFGRTVTTSVDENVTPVLNPEYDEGREYVPRMARPDWAVIGLTGRIHLRKGALTHPSWRKIKNVSAVTEEWLVR
jgi:hypothetical protein